MKPQPHQSINETRKDLQLNIAKDIIAILARNPDIAAKSMCGDGEKDALARVIEAARMTYSLPSYCGERCQDVHECLQCVIDMQSSPQCEAIMEKQPLDEMDITWITDD